MAILKWVTALVLLAVGSIVLVASPQIFVNGLVGGMLLGLGIAYLMTIK